MKFYEHRWFPVCFLVLGLLMHLLGIAGSSIYFLDEAKNATAALEMWQSGEWILPTFNGEPRYDKPPLHYYFFMLGYELFGPNALGARIFPALMGWSCFVVIYLVGKWRMGARAAFYMGLVLISSVHWMIQFRLAVPDPFLIGFSCFSVLAYESFLRSEYKAKKYLRLSAVMLALAVLSKGPIALVLVGLTFLIFMILDKKSLKSHLSSIADPIAWFLFILVAVPWYAMIAWKTNGIWLEEFIFHHNLERFSAPMEGHGGGFYLTLLFIFFGFLPGTLLLIGLFRKIFKSRKLPDIILLSLIFVVVTTVFFMISGTKLPNYTAPVYPFLAILTGWMIESGVEKRFIIPGVFASVLILLIPSGLFLAVDFVDLREIQTISYWFFIPMGFGILGLVLAFLKKMEKSWIAGSLGFLTFCLVLILQAFPQLDKANPVLNAKVVWENEAGVYHFRSFNPAFPFAMQRVIPDLESNLENLRSGDLILMTKLNLPEFEKLGLMAKPVFEGNDLFENTITVILRVE